MIVFIFGRNDGFDLGKGDTMKGRLEHTLAVEHKINNLLSGREEILRNFCLNLSLTKEPTTIYEYLKHVINFLDAVKEKEGDKDIGQITSIHIEEYLNDLKYISKNGELTNSSDSYRATVWSSLNCFFTFLFHNHYLSENLMKYVGRPKIKDDVQRVYMEPKELIDLMKTVISVEKTAIEEDKKDYAGWQSRDVLIFLLLIQTGMRITALTEINVDDIDFDNKAIKIVDKRRKTHTYPLNDQAMRYIRKWNRYRTFILQNASEDTDALFISRKKTRLSQGAVNKLIKKYTQNSGKNMTAHKFRRSYATNLYHATGDIYLVKECMGHSSINTTQIYVQSDNKSRDKALQIMERITVAD